MNNAKLTRLRNFLQIISFYFDFILGPSWGTSNTLAHPHGTCVFLSQKVSDVHYCLVLVHVHIDREMSVHSFHLEQKSVGNTLEQIIYVALHRFHTRTLLSVSKPNVQAKSSLRFLNHLNGKVGEGFS